MATNCEAPGSLHGRLGARHGSGPDKNQPNWSRRACLPLLVAAAVAPAMLALAPAAAQTVDKFIFKPAELTWQEYRRDDFGFRVEMPGKPKVYLDPDPAPFVKQTLVELPFDEVSRHCH